MVERNWIIIDTEKRKALYGINREVLRFSTEDIAIEVGTQLFENHSHMMIVNIKSDLFIK